VIDLFDKKKFSDLLERAESSHDSLNKFAAASGISAAHISRYKRMLLDNPPKPETLEKIAQYSGGKVAYDELMAAVGFVDQIAEPVIMVYGSEGKIDISDLPPESQKQIFDFVEIYKKMEADKKR
jgi:transcriptional regulator with XRE-family HTH domain